MENNKLKVLCIDTPAIIEGKSLFKCLGPVMEWLQSREDVEYRYNLYADPDLLAWADVIIVSPCEYASILASKRRYDDASFHHWNDAENRFGPGGIRDWSKAKLIIQGVDIDLLAGHWRGVSWENVDHFVTISRHGKDFLMKEAEPGKFVREIQVVPIGIDSSKWTFRERELMPAKAKVAFVSELWAAKNVPMAIQAFKHMMDSTSQELTLHVLGRKSGDSRWMDPYLDHIVGDLGIRDRVFFTETVPDVNEWLEDKDYFLHTSSKEEFSLATAECALKGIKPLTHVFPGARDIWPDEFLWNDFTELGEKMEEPIYSKSYRDFVVESYDFSKNVLPTWEKIIFGDNSPLTQEVK